MKLKLLCAAAICLSVACNKNDDVSVEGSAALNVYLTDDPSPYDEVNIDIQEVEVNVTSDSAENGWIQLPMSKKGVFNLLRLRNGIDTLLASGIVPAGKISQIRLILGTDNTVVVDGMSYPLETPSAQESGLKLNVNAEIIPGIDYKIWTDFDASRSIVTTGNGKYILKPVIRVYTKAVTGSVTGVVLPAESDAWIYALAGINDTIASARPDTLTGSFLIQGLSEGTYSLAIDGSSNYNDTLINNIIITKGVVTDAGTVQLHQ